MQWFYPLYLRRELSYLLISTGKWSTCNCLSTSSTCNNTDVLLSLPYLYIGKSKTWNLCNMKNISRRYNRHYAMRVFKVAYVQLTSRMNWQYFLLSRKKCKKIFLWFKLIVFLLHYRLFYDFVIAVEEINCFVNWI